MAMIRPDEQESVMTNSEPADFVKQFTSKITFGVFSGEYSLLFDCIINIAKLYDCFNEDLPISDLESKPSEYNIRYCY